MVEKITFIHPLNQLTSVLGANHWIRRKGSTNKLVSLCHSFAQFSKASMLASTDDLDFVACL